MTELVEALKGFTDLPIAILSFIFGIISQKSNNKTWSLLFYFVGISATLGVVAHTFVMPLLWLKIIWTVLYLLLFESVRRFAVLPIDLIKSDNNKLKKYLFILEIPFYLITLFLLYFVNDYDILILVLYSAVCLAFLVFYLVKYKYKNKYIYLIFLFLVMPIILQIMAKTYPLLVVVEHFSLFIALFIVYKISKLSK